MRQLGGWCNLFPSRGSAIFKQLVKMHELLSFPIYFLCDAAFQSRSQSIGNLSEELSFVSEDWPARRYSWTRYHFGERLRELLRDEFTMRLQTRHLRQKLLRLF